jgi:hypothetical protein
MNVVDPTSKARSSRHLLALGLWVASLSASQVLGCDPVPIDEGRADSRLFQPRGVVRGTVSYTGPRPCSRAGHISGSAIILMFHKDNPPPPSGFADRPVNFVAVPGDELFANEPRSPNENIFCPVEETITASAPFVISPLDAGEYIMVAFYDRAGRFLPTFKFRNQAEAGDLGGGFIDLVDAAKNASNPNYVPTYLPVGVGVPKTVAGRKVFEIPKETGYVADNVPVTIARDIRLTRPYFYPDASASVSGSTPQNPKGAAEFVPVITMTQDHKVLAPASKPSAEALARYEESFVKLRLLYGVPDAEQAVATDPQRPFGLQIDRDRGGVFVWARGGNIPESSAVPALWPLGALRKLVDDPERSIDVQSITSQGGAAQPVVTLLPITLRGASLATTLAGPVPSLPSAAALQQEVTLLVRPAALCVDPRDPAAGGLLVTPHFASESAEPSEGEQTIVDPEAIQKALPSVREVKQGCLPLGRYSISLVYPSGQAWTVPNEMGSCAKSEGAARADGALGSCSVKPRPVLASQGTRAVLEIVPPTSAAGQALCQEFPVPAACTRNP